MLAPVHALGPGERVCLWTRGCSKRCPGCISPEMQPATGPQVPEELLAQILTETAVKNSCRGLTVSGGDPLEIRVVPMAAEDKEGIAAFVCSRGGRIVKAAPGSGSVCGISAHR